MWHCVLVSLAFGGLSQEACLELTACQGCEERFRQRNKKQNKTHKPTKKKTPKSTSQIHRALVDSQRL